MKSFGLTDKGRVRQDNQDSFIIESCTAKDSLIVALCDGMGGAKAGGLASRLSNRAFVYNIYAKLTSRTKRPIEYRPCFKAPAQRQIPYPMNILSLTRLIRVWVLP